MTPDEKNALISFFGNIHSMAKQTDGSVVERSKFVAPISSTVKRELENVLTTEQAAAHYAPAAPVATPKRSVKHTISSRNPAACSRSGQLRCRRK